MIERLVCYRTEARASCHGISAACGKLGAFFGTAAFPLLQQSCGYLVHGVLAANLAAACVCLELKCNRGMEFVYGACGILTATVFRGKNALGTITQRMFASARQIWTATLQGILSLAAALITFSLTPREDPQLQAGQAGSRPARMGMAAQLAEVCNLEQLDASEKCV